ncbi:MAG: DUF551 domain-containing protein [Bacteroidetes bacterium]|nr:DUF551 domain-containing protein [Bacteroidota bacterium]MDA1337034.1 DUF551 domain-containing protein [Bacteroidota bacterium]
MNEDQWISIHDRLPEDDQRVLAFIKGNKVFLPGKDLAFEIREVIVLRFCENYFVNDPEKCSAFGAHFWAGEGNSNHFFNDVSYWRPMPKAPELA